MVTVNQLVREPCARRVAKSNVPTLEAYPQRHGVCIHVYITTPKKPNSVLRKVYRVRLTNGFEATSYIDGEGHNLQGYFAILIHDGRIKDLPGARYHTVCDTLDYSDVKNHKQARSEYGMECPKA